MNHFVVGILRHKTFRALWQLSLFIVFLPLYYLGYLFPKDVSLWVFANSFGFKDNARYLFEYIQDHHPEIHPIWISCRKDNQRNIRFTYSRFSIIGIWLQYRAGIAFVSTGQGDLARFTLAGTKIIQLWHGIPIKHILLDSSETLPFNKSSSLLHKISLFFLKRNLQRYSIVIASSRTVQQRLSSAFGLPEHRIQITGYPRHDILLENSNIVKKRILYAPTWRTNIQEAFTIAKTVCNNDFIDEINTLGYELWVSIHPLNKQLEEFFKPLSDTIRFIDKQDVNYILAESEILITDYSSIAIDFSFLNRKTIFYTPDIKRYLQQRGLYKEFETILLQNGAKDSSELIKKITDPTTDSYCSTNTFFHYNDTGARERIIRMVIKNFLPNLNL